MAASLPLVFKGSPLDGFRTGRASAPKIGSRAGSCCSHRLIEGPRLSAVCCLQSLLRDAMPEASAGWVDARPRQWCYGASAVSVVRSRGGELQPRKLQHVARSAVPDLNSSGVRRGTGDRVP